MHNSDYQTEPTVRRVLYDDLHYQPYKIQVVQAFNEKYYGSRRHFCESFLAVKPLTLRGSFSLVRIRQ